MTATRTINNFLRSSGFVKNAEYQDEYRKVREWTDGTFFVKSIDDNIRVYFSISKIREMVGEIGVPSGSFGDFISFAGGLCRAISSSPMKNNGKTEVLAVGDYSDSEENALAFIEGLKRIAAFVKSNEIADKWNAKVAKANESARKARIREAKALLGSLSKEDRDALIRSFGYAI